ncbi:hypothetical protein [Heliophilum fasciatum]|uniref:hypothetical protein n=1 Tax=Heliophilum fasciatum TaxID=35700 RepID=UPI00140540FA|nr:hypothetical protein [Heliophilum fasciatum]MCW2277653.1 hypothetical protein [Heliophilum fasciatum]
MRQQRERFGRQPLANVLTYALHIPPEHRQHAPGTPPTHPQRMRQQRERFGR